MGPEWIIFIHSGPIFRQRSIFRCGFVGQARSRRLLANGAIEFVVQRLFRATFGFDLLCDITVTLLREVLDLRLQFVALGRLFLHHRFAVFRR